MKLRNEYFPERLRLFVSAAGVGEALHAEGELLEARHQRGDAEGEARLLQRLDVVLRRQADLSRVEELEREDSMEKFQLGFRLEKMFKC